MLTHLRIEQFVIIDIFDMDFEPGLTVITGETGAGKSILLDALGIMFGDAPNPESIRQGSQQAVIEARFVPPSESAVWPLLMQNELVSSPEGAFTIRRVIKRDGPEEMLLNQHPVEIGLLTEIGRLLGEIHGQNANHSIMDPANQMHLLDLSAEYPPEILQNVGDALRLIPRLEKELEDERRFFARHGHELKSVEDIVKRFNDVGMKRGFLEETRNQRKILLTAKETGEAFQTVLAQMVAGTGAVRTLVSANEFLAKQKNLDRTKTIRLFELLESSLDSARSAVDEMQRLAPDYDIDLKPLQKYEQILTTLQHIATERKLTPEELENYYEEMVAKLERIRKAPMRIRELDESVIKAKDAYRAHAHVLSLRRREAARKLGAAITAELPPLKMMRAEFEVMVEEKPDSPWTELGFDHVTFAARMNPGMPFSPIAETASGGELARIILAMKAVLQDVLMIPTLVFDEVDVGLGGAGAAAVGDRIARISDKTQVLIITHSPQVASRGDRHLYISKKSDGVTTVSTAWMLTIEERITEISRMLAGDVVTSEAHAAAQSLLDEAAESSAKRQGKNHRAHSSGA